MPILKGTILLLPWFEDVQPCFQLDRSRRIFHFTRWVVICLWKQLQEVPIHLILFSIPLSFWDHPLLFDIWQWAVIPQLLILLDRLISIEGYLLDHCCNRLLLLLLHHLSQSLWLSQTLGRRRLILLGRWDQPSLILRSCELLLESYYDLKQSLLLPFTHNSPFLDPYLLFSLLCVQISSSIFICVGHNGKPPLLKLTHLILRLPCKD